MAKNNTEEKKLGNIIVGQVINRFADKLRSEMDFDLAQRQMYLAEKDLIESLNAKQLELYKDFSDKRDAFYKVASQIYQKKF